ncbi:CPBP family glutamic-type intramembrane protease [Paenibacillus sp. BAC0078]
MNFVLVFPIMEEIAFRGLVLPVLARHNVLEQGLQVFYIFSVSFAVIITAFLFAVAFYAKKRRVSAPTKQAPLP